MLSAMGAAAQSLPEPFEADYQAAKFLHTAKTRIQLVRAGEYYKYTMRSVVRGPFERGETYDCSVLRVVKNRLLPLAYVHERKDRESSNVRTRFDWSHNTIITALSDGREREIKNVRGSVWDVLSIQLALLRDALSPEDSGPADYSVVNRGRLTSYRATREGVETIEVAGGSVKTVKVKVVGPKHTNWFWFAPDYTWLPVRMNIGEVVFDLVSPPGRTRREANAAVDRPPGC